MIPWGRYLRRMKSAFYEKEKIHLFLLMRNSLLDTDSYVTLVLHDNRLYFVYLFKIRIKRHVFHFNELTETFIFMFNYYYFGLWSIKSEIIFHFRKIEKFSADSKTE